MTDLLSSEHRRRLGEVAALFLKLGTTAFGGPAAHIALMEDEIVRRRGWMTHQRFLDMLAAANLIPGPNSTELAIHVGLEQAGPWGLVLAGTCFILPAMLLTLAFAWLYVRFGALPAAVGFLYGVKIVVVAVIVQALLRLGRSALTTPGLAITAALAMAANALGVNELAVLGAAGLALALARGARRGSLRGLVPPITLAPAAVAATVVAVPFSLDRLFLFFVKTGSVLFGSGYVLLAFLRADLVDHWHWLTEQQLLDAVAVGQFTPGPLFTTATFVGYVLGGVPGALVATLGIFLPAFVFVAISGPIVPRLRASKTAGDVLDGVVVASLALMAVVSAQLARAAIVDLPSAVMLVVSGLLLWRCKINSVWLILGGGVLGLLLKG